MERARVPVLDVEVTPVTVEGVVSALSSMVKDSQTHVIAGHNLHSVTLHHSDPEFARFYADADMILMDGAPVAKLYARSLGLDAAPFRLGSIDWLSEISQVSGLQRVAVIGAGEEANAGAVKVLSGRLPQARVEGFAGAGWNQERQNQALTWLGRLRPQLVLVGLGMPLQERVIKELSSGYPGAVYASVGGAIEQLSGAQKLAPRWVGKLGAEWAWRLLFDPRRVAYRVFVEPWKLLALLAKRRLTRGGQR